MPASAKSAASVQNGAPTHLVRSGLGLHGAHDLLVRRDLHRVAPERERDRAARVAEQPTQLGLDVLAALAGDRAALALQQAPRGIARVLLAALDQRGVHRSGAEQRVAGPGLERRGPAPRSRRGRGPSSRSRRCRDPDASRARPGRGSRCRRRASPDGRCRGARRSARRRSPRRHASVRAEPRCRCSPPPRRRPRRRSRPRAARAARTRRRRSRSPRGSPSCRRRRGRRGVRRRPAAPARRPARGARPCRGARSGAACGRRPCPARRR